MEATRLRAGGRPGGSRQLPGLPARRTGCDIAPAHLSGHPSTRPTHPSISAHSAEHWLLGRIARTQPFVTDSRGRVGPAMLSLPASKQPFSQILPLSYTRTKSTDSCRYGVTVFFPEHIVFSQPGLREAQPKVGLCSPLFHIFFYF